MHTHTHMAFKIIHGIILVNIKFRAAVTPVGEETG